MRHRRHRYKLGVRLSHRDLLLRNLATSLFLHGEIETTIARAKALRPLAEKLIAIARDPDLEVFNKYRRIRRFVQNREAVDHIFRLAAAHPERTGGFVQLFRIGFRRGDAAPMVRVRLIDYELPEPAEKPAKAKKENA